jgi:hypothetical protein
LDTDNWNLHKCLILLALPRGAQETLHLKGLRQGLGENCSTDLQSVLGWPPKPTGHRHLSQANKLSRTYAVLLDALNRYRGKEGQQKVTVEHVDVRNGPAASHW